LNYGSRFVERKMVERRKHCAKSAQFRGYVPGVNGAAVETNWNLRARLSISERPGIWVLIREGNMEVCGAAFESSSEIEPRSSPTGAQIDNRGVRRRIKSALKQRSGRSVSLR
jgi:hypothetical protein